jgi:hypothetical protein
MPRPRKRPIRRPGLTSTPASNASRSATTSSATVWNSPPLRWVCPASANSSQPRSAGRYGWRRGDGRQADDDQEADYFIMATLREPPWVRYWAFYPGAGKFTSAASTWMTTSLGREAGHRSRQLAAIARSTERIGRVRNTLGSSSASSIAQRRVPPAKIPISGRLRMTSIALPTHIEAMRPQNSSGSERQPCGIRRTRSPVCPLDSSPLYTWHAACWGSACRLVRCRETYIGSNCVLVRDCGRRGSAGSPERAGQDHNPNCPRRFGRGHYFAVAKLPIRRFDRPVWIKSEK